MHATFMNKFVFSEPESEESIKYIHQFRVDVEVFIKHKKKPDRNWDLIFSRSRGSVPTEIRQGLIIEFMEHVRRRAKKSVNTLSYDDFVELTKAVNIA